MFRVYERVQSSVKNRLVNSVTFAHFYIVRPRADLIWNDGTYFDTSILKETKITKNIP